jgi:hypothetical protein
MRYHEIIGPRSHPHIATIVINPADFQQFERLTEDRPEVRLLHCDDSEADCWALTLACASPEVVSLLESGWA